MVLSEDQQDNIAHNSNENYDPSNKMDELLKLLDEEKKKNQQLQNLFKEKSKKQKTQATSPAIKSPNCFKSSVEKKDLTPMRNFMSNFIIRSASSIVDSENVDFFSIFSPPDNSIFASKPYLTSDFNLIQVIGPNHEFIEERPLIVIKNELNECKLRRTTNMPICSNSYPLTIKSCLVDDEGPLKEVLIKYIKFHENYRPPFLGSSNYKLNLKCICKKPFSQVIDDLDYQNDSDLEWGAEDNESVESLHSSDDEEMEDEDDLDEAFDFLIDDEGSIPEFNSQNDLNRDKKKLTFNNFFPNKIGKMSIVQNFVNPKKGMNHNILATFSIQSIDGQYPIEIKSNDNKISSNQRTVKSKETQTVGNNLKDVPEDSICCLIKYLDGKKTPVSKVIVEFQQYWQNVYCVKNQIEFTRNKLSKKIIEKKIHEIAGRVNSQSEWEIKENFKSKYSKTNSLSDENKTVQKVSKLSDIELCKIINSIEKNKVKNILSQDAISEFRKFITNLKSDENVKHKEVLKRFQFSFAQQLRNNSNDYVYLHKNIPSIDKLLNFAVDL
ncbi:MAG: chromatin assembly factor-I (CAF-I) p90 subunit [Marteilia pararefringens]